MIYLDTHVAVWLAAGRVDLLSEHASGLVDGEDVAISPMVTLELQYLHEIGRLALRGNDIVQGLQTQIGLRTCGLSFARVVDSACDQRWTRDPFDRLIVAHAAAAQAVLLTADADIRRHYARAEW